ncbi:MAG: hypothetical protein KTR18_06605, partial [Acidiferrobacterales bacterium]|nr:hypothetical protein [Acidiferrobacterales bacterium]
MKIEYPIEWDERDHLERPCKGWLENVVVTDRNGVKHQLCFYDPTRLNQDLTEELKNGKAGIVERGLLIVPEVSKDA